ncbi:MAG: ABC transporter permease, partial [Gemmatimonadaceae bacterium]
MAGWRRRTQEDFEAEIRAHIELEAEQLRAAGVPGDEALAAARRRFGNVTAAQERFHDARRLPLVDALLQDLRYAWRTLQRSPGFAVVVLLTLALGIGSTTAIFSIVDAIVLRGLSYRDPSRLRVIYERSDDGNMRVPSYPTFRDWEAQTASLAGAINGFAFVRGDGVDLPGSDGPERRIAAYVTPGFFRLMGTRPAVGRTFAPDEERPGAARVAVISWELFLSRFGGDPSVLGKSLPVDSMPTTIIGVMPHGFAFPNFAGSGRWIAPALWQPIAVFQATHPQLALRGLHVDSRTVVRLRPGADSARVVAAMRTIQRRLAQEYPVEQGRWTSVALQPLGRALYGDLPSALLLISAAIGLVLLLACANVANLFLVRGSVRVRELAVRSALGAGRWRLARQFLAEALVLACLAGALGVLLAAALVSFVQRAAAERLPFVAELHVN